MIVDLAQQRFGRLLVMAFAGPDNKGRALWNCECDCGQFVVARSSSLRRGHKQSCGCLLPMVNSAANRTHGAGRTPEYRSWESAKQRCLNPKNQAYREYGGRGISVCDRWMVGENGVGPFECFLEDMGKKPSKSHSLDRRDPDGNYEPSNCRWATPKEQQRNRRNTVRVELDGKTIALSDACDLAGISYEVAWGRLRKGASVAESLRRRDAPR